MKTSWGGDRADGRMFPSSRARSASGSCDSSVACGASARSEGLTVSQLSVLGIIDREGPLSPTQLAATERVQPPSMTRVVAALEELGLVQRRDPRERRPPVRDRPHRGRQRPARRGPQPEAGLAGLPP